jgi:hypothetical protein
MRSATEAVTTNLVRDSAQALVQSREDYDCLLEFIGNAGSCCWVTSRTEPMSSIVVSRMPIGRERIGRIATCGVKTVIQRRGSPGRVQTFSCLDLEQCGCAGLHRLAPRAQRFTRAGFKKNRILRS